MGTQPDEEWRKKRLIVVLREIYEFWGRSKVHGLFFEGEGI